MSWDFDAFEFIEAENFNEDLGLTEESVGDTSTFTSIGQLGFLWYDPFLQGKNPGR